MSIRTKRHTRLYYRYVYKYLPIWPKVYTVLSINIIGWNNILINGPS